MTRETWFRVLQVAVVAPWLYHLSGTTTSPYFRLGLKLVAGSVVMMNIKPLLQDADKIKADAASIVAALKDVASKQRVPVTIDAETVTDA